MTYKITITVTDKAVTTDTISQAVSYLSGALRRMHISHTVECHKDAIKLSKVTVAV